jgi:DNA-binding CsgD family transcriptional regulator
MLQEVDYQAWTMCLQKLDIAKHDLSLWLSAHLRKFFPFEKVIIATGSAVAGEIRVEHLLAIDHSQEYLGQLSQTFDVATRSSLASWLQTREPFVISGTDTDLIANQFELDEIRQFKLGTVAAHGVLNMGANAGTYCSFSGVPDRALEWHTSALRLIAPVVNDLMLNRCARLRENSQRDALNALSPRQRLIARHVTDGQADKEIARHLAISEKTVRNQLSMMYSQLGIRQRTQLIGILRG